MTARLRSGLLVSGLIRRAAAEGGHAAVLARGDESAGGILAVIAQRGEIKRILERGHDLDGRPVWRDSAPQVLEGKIGLHDYLTRRRALDMDLWAIELDIADGERFVAEMTAAN